MRAALILAVVAALAGCSTIGEYAKGNFETNVYCSPDKTRMASISWWLKWFGFGSKIADVDAVALCKPPPESLKTPVLGAS